MATVVYTIGYGNRSLHDLVAILDSYDIEFLIDVRSHPNSRFNPEYNKPELIRFFGDHRIQYVHWGDELGGRPDNTVVKRNGRAVFSLIMELPAFQDKVSRVADARDKGLKVCLMCSELAPENCHRSMLIGVVLHERDVQVVHIDGEGSPIPHPDVMSRVDRSQPMLFEDTPGTSTRRYRSD